MSTKGNFKISDSQIFINTFPFYSNNAEVVLTDSIVEVKNADSEYYIIIYKGVSQSSEFPNRLLLTSGQKF